MSLFKPFLARSHLLSPVAPLLCLQDHGNPNNSQLSSTGLVFIYIYNEENPLSLLIKFPQLKRCYDAG